jgi:glycosyltransferase involved in cell wall biosynthesis
MLSWEYPPHVVGGLGAHVTALVPALARAGVEVHLVTPRWVGGESRETIVGRKPRVARSRKSLASQSRVLPSATVYRVDPPVAAMGNFYADTQQTNLNLEEQGQTLFDQCGAFDLIHAHEWLVAFAATSLKRIHKIPLLATMHATERGRGRGHLNGAISEAINGAEWWLTYEAWRIVCTSQFMADEVKAYFQVPPDKIDVVPNGVDCAPFDALDAVDLSDFRARWARADQRIVFSVGRLVHEKGARLLVEAAPHVLAEIPQTKIIIAGTGSMSDYLKRRVWELGVSDRVDVVGFISDDDRNRLLKAADVAVFPSLYEPFGIVALEAMAAKCPVVVSSVGGLGEVVQHNETGITVYPDNVESLGWGILHTLHRPDWAKARAEKAYRMVKAEYSWEHIAAKTIEVYERIARECAKTEWWGG